MINLSETPECTCGEGIEDADHFLVECRNYQMQRAQTYLNHGINLSTFDAEELLEGNPTMTNEHNTKLFEAVHNFIENTGRFLMVNLYGYFLPKFIFQLLSKEIFWLEPP